MIMQDVVSRYRRILVAEESLAALDDAVRLARRIASGDAGRKNGRWAKITKGMATSPPPRGAAAAMASRARDVAWHCQPSPGKPRGIGTCPNPNIHCSWKRC